LEIRAGQSIAVIGASGGGKSTLLRLIEGSLPAQGPAVRVRKRVALVYQDLRLVNERTALENAVMGAFSRSSPWSFRFDQEWIDEANELLRALGLGDQVDQPVSLLSGGQRQRVAIARALMSRPLLLLADEPFAHLDPRTGGETLELIKKLQRDRGFALVVTTHDASVAAGAFDDVWRVSNGRLARGDGSATVACPSPISRRDRRREVEIGAVSTLLTLVLLSLVFLPRLGLDAENLGSETLATLARIFLPSFDSLTRVSWWFLMERLLLTVQMALLATTISFFVAAPLAFLGAQGFMPGWISHPVRGALMALRAIPALVWALIFVSAVGLGPVAGVLALIVYSLGYFTKFLYEGLEDLDRKSFSVLRQLGASAPQAFFHAILPTAQPLLVSSFVFMLEYNVRSASILGLVGAGGVGQDLMYALEWRDFPTVFAILLYLVALVVALDRVSSWVRRRFKTLRGV
jgi:phosphonate transport system permease protein